MSPTEQITFAPEISERDLDREVGQIDDRLASVGEDVPVSFDEDELDSLSPPGGGGGGGGIGAGGAIGLGAIASKIPKPVAGVTAASALPIALAGGVGLGLLSAMQGASARLQTSTSLFGIAVDNFFREPAKVLDEAIARPLANATLDVATDFDELARSEGLAVAVASLDDKAAGAIGTAFTDTLSGQGTIGDIVLTGSAAVAAGALVSAIGWPSIGGSAILSATGLASAGVTAAGVVGAISWPFVGAALITGAMSWGSFQSGDLISAMGWGTVTGAATVAALGFGTVTGGAVVGAIAWPTISATQVLAKIATGEEDPTEGTPFESVRDFGEDVGNRTRDDDQTSFLEMFGPIAPAPSFFSRFTDSGQAGGRVASSGLAEIHQNEFIGDRDRLVSELADAIDAAGGGGSGSRPVTVDTSTLENEVKGLRQDVSRLASAMQDMELRTDAETIGRVASEGKRQGLGGRDPTV
jgi:hypothetical protein